MIASGPASACSLDSGGRTSQDAGGQHHTAREEKSMKDVTARGGRVLGLALTAIVLSLVAASAATAADPVKIALVAALSGQSAKSGEGITRGLTIAIDEIGRASCRERV